MANKVKKKKILFSPKNYNLDHFGEVWLKFHTTYGPIVLDPEVFKIYPMKIRYRKVDTMNTILLSTAV